MKETGRKRRRAKHQPADAPREPGDNATATVQPPAIRSVRNPKKGRGKLRFARPGDTNYLNPAFHPVIEPGETWFSARIKQVAAIKAAEAKAKEAARQRAAKKKSAHEARRAHVASSTDIVNARPAAASEKLRSRKDSGAATDGTMPYQDNSPLKAPARVRGKGGSGERPSKPKARLAPIASTRQTLSSFSSSLRQAFPSLIPLRPYCGNDLEQGIWIWPRQRALVCLHVQFNHPTVARWLVVDIDRPGAYFADEDALLPAFNVVMVNPVNGHAHAAYVLDAPVGWHDAALPKPLKLLAAVERGLTRRLGGDRGYAGLLAKNPLHLHWRVEWRRDAPYSLDELAGSLTEEDMRPDRERASFGFGRNCAIFDQLRTLAYREVLAFKRSGRSAEAWRSRLFSIALTMNGQFVEPLSDLEVRGIAKSVAKWTWKHFTEEGFAVIQSKRAQIRWRGHEAESTTKPWLKAGISRRTHYRRKKRAR